jgi:UDP-N-acetyl-D-mannosaminuronic acid dehydrogenase
MTQPYETVSIVGLGYIGLPTAAVFASRKVKVIGVDVNPHAVDTINRGEIHIVEPDLDMVVHTAVKEGYLRATMRPEPADAFLIAVPTPFKDGPTGPHHPDMDYIEAASKSIAPVLNKGNLIILESTSPVGATEQLAAWLAEARPDLKFPQTHGEESDIRVAYCPERVLPGQVLRELVHNDRVIGGMTPKCSEAAAKLYKTFVQGACVITDARTAEMCKLTENSFRDVNIAFANELSVICDKLGIDVWELIRLANRHPRVKILQPGPGVGGHCIAVDPWFIVSATPAEARLIRTSRQVNDDKPAWVLNKIEDELNRQLSLDAKRSAAEITVACLGITFKPDIDDLRESPSLHIAKEVSRRHVGRMLVVEPHISELPPGFASNTELWTLPEALAVSDIIVVLVGHKDFKRLQPNTWHRRGVIDVCGVASCGTSR